MFAGNARLASLVFAAFVLTWSQFACGLGFELAETKEQLKLKYDVSWMDHHTGRVTVNVAIADEGKLGPLRSVELQIRPDDGTGYVDLSTTLSPREADGKRIYSVHLSRELAERAAIRLVTDHFDGKKLPLTWYYHQISMEENLTAEQQIPNPPAPKAKQSDEEPTPPPATPSP
ncbi:MAG TPA: hypothetical protein VGN57_00625 [Pirellulaceae bacterium]|jgi:hypothetical protein|nr:hypothetical protein [Pirellulaceae bacterium]